MAGGNLAAGGGVVHILDAVRTQAQPPVRLRLFGELRHNLLIHAGCLVELTVHAQAIRAVEQVGFLLTVRAGDGLLAAAVFAFADGAARLKGKVAAAHFALDYHDFISPLSPALQSLCAAPAPPSSA